MYNFEILHRVRDSVPFLFCPKDPDLLLINRRRYKTNVTVLYSISAWVERCHNIQTEILDNRPNDQTTDKKLEAAGLHPEYTRFVLHHVKEFSAVRYDNICLSHTHGEAYAQAVEEFVSDIPSDIKSGAALCVGRALRQAQLKHTIQT